MCIKIRNLSWKVISSAAYRGKATQHCKESFACAWRDTGGGVTGSRGKFLWRCVWNVLGNFCNLIHNNMRFVINHFRTEIKIMQFKYHYIKKIDNDLGDIHKVALCIPFLIEFAKFKLSGKLGIIRDHKDSWDRLEGQHEGIQTWRRTTSAVF